MARFTVDAASTPLHSSLRVSDTRNRYSLTWTGTQAMSLVTYRSTDVVVASRLLRTLVDSTPGVLKAWELLGAEYGFNGAQVAHESHGRRLYDTVREYCRIHDEETLQVRITIFRLRPGHVADTRDVVL